MCRFPSQWRGFALPRLLTERSPLVASLILGVFWSLWHLPVVLSDPVLRVPIPFFLAVIPLSILTTWIFLRTDGSLFIQILFHAWYDVVLAYAGAMIGKSDYSRMWWLIVAAHCVAVVIVLTRRGLSTGKEASLKPRVAIAPI